VKTSCRSDGGASRDMLGYLGTSGGAPLRFRGVRRRPDGSSYTPDERGVEHVHTDCGGGKGAREEVSSSCRHVGDERLGMAAS